MKKWLVLVLILGCFPLPGRAALTENDFAYGMKVEVPKGSAIVALTLPGQIYKNIVRKDLGDIRVFNAAGEAVPHLARYVRADRNEPAWHPLAFFPLPEIQENDPAGYSIYVKTGPDGAVVRMESKTVEESHARPIREFLIDLSAEKESLTALRLEWPPEDENRIATLAVEASNDLAHWSSVQTRAAITDIRYGGHRLRNDEIPLNRYAGRYLRIRQTDTGQPVPLTGIYGRPPVSGVPDVRPFLRLETVKPSVEPGVFEYDSRGGFPVDRINLVFPQTNSMADALLESRDGPGAPWTKRLKSLFYRIDANGIDVVSTPKPVAMTTDRYWRLTVTDSESTIGNTAPLLETGFRPHTLFFIARGEGPFTLAFGSAVVQPPQSNAAALFDGIDRENHAGLERWVFPGPMVTLGGPQKLSPPAQPLPLRRILLWSLLVAGVLVVAAMAWHLARGMKTEI